MPQSTVQQRLNQLSTLNGDLVRLLNSHPLAPSQPESTSQPIQFLLRDCHEAVDLYEVISEGYSCDCNEPHVANFCLHQAPHTLLTSLPGIRRDKWTFELLFPSGRAESSSPTRLLLPGHSGETILESDASTIADQSDERYA